MRIGFWCQNATNCPAIAIATTATVLTVESIPAGPRGLGEAVVGVGCFGAELEVRVRTAMGSGNSFLASRR
jgi:hypothetical protein